HVAEAQRVTRMARLSKANANLTGGQAPQQRVQTGLQQFVVDQNVVRNEKISTFDKGQVQLIFADQSTLTLAENSEIVIDEFVYDPQKQAGSMTATVTTGVLRYVGGKISKKNDVSFLTPSGVVTVRGGIALIKVSEKPGATPSKSPVTAEKR